MVWNVVVEVTRPVRLRSRHLDRYTNLEESQINLLLPGIQHRIRPLAFPQQEIFVEE
jgi:hypothetical protein